LRLAVRVSADLRRQALRARTVTVKLRTPDFVTRTAQRSLTRFVESERAVSRVARELLVQLRAGRGGPVRLLGIALSHFDDDDAPLPPALAQLGLFQDPAATAAPEAEPDEAREQALTRALDRIRGRFGQDAILPARLVDRAPDTGPRVEE
jgi:DNA polymerase IV